MEQVIANLVYAILFILAVVSAGVVVFARKAVYCALGLVLTMLCLAGVFLLIQAPFVALIQVLVYAGAVMVLFLYVVMLINPRLLEPISEIAMSRRAWSVFLGLAFLFVAIAWALGVRARMGETAPPELIGLREIANLLLTRYLLAFELTSVLLLVAIIGAVLIARRHETEKPNG